MYRHQARNGVGEGYNPELEEQYFDALFDEFEFEMKKAAMGRGEAHSKFVNEMFARVYAVEDERDRETGERVRLWGEMTRREQEKSAAKQRLASSSSTQLSAKNDYQHIQAKEELAVAMEAFKKPEKAWIGARQRQLVEVPSKRRNWQLYKYAGPDDDDAHSAYRRRKKSADRAKRHLRRRRRQRQHHGDAETAADPCQHRRFWKRVHQKSEASCGRCVATRHLSDASRLTCVLAAASRRAPSAETH